MATATLTKVTVHITPTTRSPDVLSVVSEGFKYMETHQMTRPGQPRKNTSSGSGQPNNIMDLLLVATVTLWLVLQIFDVLPTDIGETEYLLIFAEFWILIPLLLLTRGRMFAHLDRSEER